MTKTDVGRASPARSRSSPAERRASAWRRPAGSWPRAGRSVVGDLDAAALEPVAKELGDAVATVAGDVSVEADVERLVGAALERFGRLDVAFANAGIGSIARLVDLDVAEWSRVLDVNLTGPYLMIKHAAPAHGRGRVDRRDRQPERGAGRHRHGRVLRVEGRRRHAGARSPRWSSARRASASTRSGPGLVRTALTEGAFALPGIVEEYVENTPLGRYAAPRRSPASWRSSRPTRRGSSRDRSTSSTARPTPSATPTSSGALESLGGS